MELIMSDSLTTHFGFTQPQVNGSINTWGIKLNSDLQQIDTLLWNIGGGITAGLYAPASSPTSLTLSNPMVNYNSLTYTASGQSTVMPVMNASTSPQVGTLLSLYNAGTFGFRVLANDGSTAIFGTGVASGTITAAGSTYTNGYYPDVALTGGTGTGATADITVAGNVVTKVWLRGRGKNFGGSASRASPLASAYSSP